MKRPLIALVSIISVAGLLLLPAWWSGVQIESAFHERLASITSNGNLQKTESTFERGLLSSTANVALQTADKSVRIHLQHRIEHGPLPIARWLRGEAEIGLSRGHISTNGTVVFAVSTLLNGALDFTADSRIDLGGVILTTVTSPPASKRLENGVSVGWKGLQGEIEIDPDKHAVRTDLRAPEFSFASGRISGVRLHSENSELAVDRRVGTLAVDIGTLAFAALRAEKIRIGTESSIQSDMLTLSFSYDVDKFSAGTAHYGPGHLAMVMRKLDRPALARFQKEMSALRAGGRPAEQVTMMQFGKLLQLAGELSRKAPELEMTELQLGVGGEEIRGKAKLTLDGRKVDIAKNPLLILTTLAGDMDLWLPSAVIKPILLPLLRADLAGYRARGLLAQEPTAQQEAEILDQMFPAYAARNDFTRRLVRDGNRYRLTASLRRGQILVNGEPLNISAATLLPRLP